MVINNQNISLKINIRDSCIVCFDILACCRGNTVYFNQLEKILDHPNILEIIMRYFLNHDISNWNSGEIPFTKMKIDTIYD